MEATVEYAETHLALLLRCVEQGEEVILRNGDDLVARIVPFPHPQTQPRPQVGEITSAPVIWRADSFPAVCQRVNALTALNDDIAGWEQFDDQNA